MARLSISGGAAPPSTDLNSINLTRMVARLHQLLIVPDLETEARLKASSLEREKVATNLQYANELLLKLEQDAQYIKILSKKQEMQLDLVKKRDVLLRIEERLQELNEVRPILLAIPLFQPNTSPPPSIPQTEPHSPPPPYSEPEAQSTLRSRAPKETETQAHNREKAALFSSGIESQSQARKSTISTSTKETLLTHHRTEQEQLTASLLTMASALKQSSNAFSSSLADEKDILDNASKGMDKNELGLEAASRKMGMLRSMSEGRGWWGRMVMYAWIAGLAVLAVLIVFVGPKFRF
ncbi:synaptobrevin [Halenospora varia]|nr:synaptobrevin [Halenospora varia]